VTFDDDNERLMRIRRLDAELHEAAEAKAQALEDGSEAGRLKATIVRALDCRRRAKMFAKLYCEHDEHEHEAVELIKAARADEAVAMCMQKLDELGIRVKLSRVADDEIDVPQGRN
jgi:hypothetical protein